MLIFIGSCGAGREKTILVCLSPGDPSSCLRGGRNGLSLSADDFPRYLLPNRWGGSVAAQRCRGCRLVSFREITSTATVGKEESRYDVKWK
ncbi:hypothetical protein TNCT_161841 [Trichonephila clavata]|uniref:Uncharacterized protein n=1 Tax=Trichonephila clavata TaxID=2740835 RepID=A0A8X6EZ82_TRICU|nr:hypothetical protein TNCT_161841 [Trichonephila clavata]